MFETTLLSLRVLDETFNATPMQKKQASLSLASHLAKPAIRRPIFKSTASSNDTSCPSTPAEDDELFIDRLWEQVRSKARKLPIFPSPSPAEVRESCNEIGPVGNGTIYPRLTRRKSITYRDSADGRNTVVIFDLPGVKKSDVHVSFQYKRLVVSYKLVREVEKRERQVRPGNNGEAMYSSNTIT
ncbi:hypothetical protein DFH11DRAFT_856256 [Phellopilus nigrolimitatus]|nr:hypothetical protein DFH11DRAFT_856256 [Phellopilus nigrolimitatus]